MNFNSIFEAIGQGTVEDVRYFIEEKGADVNSKNDDGCTLLQLAALVENVKVAEYLISKGADVNVKDDDGATPLHASALSGNVEIAKLLVSKGVNVNATANSGTTPLHFAAQFGNVEVAEFLIENGANINIKTHNDRMSPLVVAVNKSQIEIIRLLVSKGADINSTTTDNWTPIHWAIQARDLEVIKFLIENGADVNTKTEKGNTPLDMASQAEDTAYDTANGEDEEWEAIVQYLTSVGAKKNITKPSGGCYIATAVYGSYDCPQVWTLRRYRDNTLANNIFGRAFISIYYSVSPIIVKFLGSVEWFTRFSRSRLDRLVYKLRKNGYKDTPYND